LVPEYFYHELREKMSKVKGLTRLSKEELDEALEVILEQVETVADPIILDFVEEAKRVSTDPKDAPYVALAMALDVPLLTGDKKLAESVKGRVKVLTLRDALELV